MIAGTLCTLAGVVWMVGAYWQQKARQPGMAAMYIAIGALNIAVGAMYLCCGIT